MTNIDLDAVDTDVMLTFSPDPSREGYAVIEYDDEHGDTRLGSFKIRDLLIIRHATAVSSYQPEQTRSKPPIWMREN